MEVQEIAFRKQLQLAVALKLPVLVHCRKAFKRTLMILKEENALKVGGIMHAFSGSVEMASEFIQLGFTIAICGTVTWDGAVRPVTLAREIPVAHLVLETDAPDLSPQPFRGKPNQPAWLLHTLHAVAKNRGMLVEDFLRATHGNTLRVLKKLNPQVNQKIT